MKDILNVINKQKHLNNIQPNISKQKKNKQKHLRNIQPDMSKQKKRKQKHYWLNTTTVASQLCLSQVWTLLTTFTGVYLMFCWILCGPRLQSRDDTF